MPRRYVAQTPPMFLIVQHANSYREAWPTCSRHDDTYTMYANTRDRVFSARIGIILFYDDAETRATSRRVTHYDIDKCDILLTARNHVHEDSRKAEIL